MTLEEMASAIKNNVGGGLREVYNHAYSITQLEDEINNMRAQIILENSETGILQPEFFLQKIDNLALKLVRFPYGGYSNSPERVMHTTIPKLAPTADNSAIQFFGPPDMSLDIKRYYDDSFNSHRYSRVIKDRPFVYIDVSITGEGEHDTYFFNIENNNLKTASIRAIFDDPIKLMEDQGQFAHEKEFPAPLAIQEMIIDRLTMKYVEYYRKMNQGYQPNTETDTR